MKSTAYVCCAASVGLLASATKEVYHAPATAQPQYVAPSKYEAPVKDTPSYEEVSKTNFDQFWDNMALCDAEYDLDDCLLKAKTAADLIDDQHVADCTTQFVTGLCGKLSTTVTGKCDNGYVSLTTDNCETAAFADAFLVINRMVSGANSILGKPMTSFDTWTFANIKMALEATENNADCVTQSFFNYLNQCASSQYISENDMQCVEDVLTQGECAFAEESGDNWTLPALIEKYGVEGAQKAIDEMKKTYGYTEDEDIVPAMRKVMEGIASDKAHGSRFVSTDYNKHKQEASLTACPWNYLTMNHEHYKADGGEFGLPEDLVTFHFPVTKDPVLNIDEESDAPLDPITDYNTIYDTCEAYFHDTQEVFDREDETTHLGNRCYSISGYNLHNLESGEDKALSYKKVEGEFASDNYQCFKATWYEARSCSSHLTQWQMKVACCKSYATVVAEHEPSTGNYLQAQYHSAQAPYTQPPYTKPAHAPYTKAPYTKAPYAKAPYTQAPYLQQKPHYDYYTPAPTAPQVKIDKKSLMFEKYVNSNSAKGSIDPKDSIYPARPLPTVLSAALDQYLAGVNEICGSIVLNKLSNYKYYGLKKHCERVKEMSETASTYAPESLLMEQYAYNVTEAPAPEYVIAKSYYMEDKASEIVCTELNIDLDFSEIIPIVTEKCYPQSCILAQLASCMEIPEKEYSHYGYEYVTDPYAKQEPEYKH